MSAPVRLPGVAILLPCFNEIGNVTAAVAEARAAAASAAHEYEVIVVDDGSTDGTGAVARALAAAYPRVRVLEHELNRGYGAALRTGIAAVRMPWLLLTDADLQFDLMQLRQVTPLTGSDDPIPRPRPPRPDPLHPRALRHTRERPRAPGPRIPGRARGLGLQTPRSPGA